MNIVVASGKGGTGKTTVSSILSLIVSETGKTLYVDADVEEPNGHLLLKPDITEEITFTLPVPKINENICTFCGRCAEVCEFKALVIIPKTHKWLFFPQLCHSCSLCVEVCPEKNKGAIVEVPKKQGVIRKGKVKDNLYFIEGRLNLGEPSGVRLISSLKTHIDQINATYTVIDAPPGTSCPVVEAMELGEIVILTTEPTPFGLEDLKMAVEVVEKLGKKVFVVINKHAKFDELDEFLKLKGLKVLFKIPYSRKISEWYSRGEIEKIVEFLKSNSLININEIIDILKNGQRRNL